MYPFLSIRCLLLILSILVNAEWHCVKGAEKANGVDNDGSYIGPELEKELRLTKREKHALDKLKLVMPKESTMPYMQMDLFQIRWLRAHFLDVDRTVRELNEVIRIRRAKKMENFWNQDWSDLFPKHPFTSGSFDKEGRPIATLSIGEVDMRRIVLQGKRERLFTYLTNVGIEVMEGMAKINRNNPNITQVVFLVNLDGFNPIQHTCPLCLTFYIYILELNERFLPGFTHDAIFINTPSVYGVFLEMFKPTLSEHTRNILRIFGLNKNKWKPYLDSIIEPSQLTWEFGGTKLVDRDD